MMILKNKIKEKKENDCIIMYYNYKSGKLQLLYYSDVCS